MIKILEVRPGDRTFRWVKICPVCSEGLVFDSGCIEINRKKQACITCPNSKGHPKNIPVKVPLTKNEIKSDSVLVGVIKAKREGKCGCPVIITEDMIRSDPELVKVVEDKRREWMRRKVDE